MASFHGASDESICSPAPRPTKKRKRIENQSVNKPCSQKRGKTKQVIGKTKRGKTKEAPIVAKAKRMSARESNIGGKTTFSVDSIMTSFKDTTEYGQSFRCMTSEQQTTEVVRLNKGAAIGMKAAIKNQRITSQFKDVVTDKMKEYVIHNRTQPTEMFRAFTASRVLHHMKLSHISVGEWVDVAADITPGWNSEGGIGVIIKITDSLVDVK